MADNYYPMGGVPDFYGQLLNSAQQQLVRMPDGSYRAAPTYSPPTTLGQIYGGMYSQPGSSGSASLRADPVGDLSASGGWNQFDDQFNQPATLSPRAGTVRTASAAPSIPGPRGSISLTKDQARLDPGTALAFAGETSAPPGIAAIDAATQQPFIPPLPRIRPSLPTDMRFTPAVPGPYAGGDPWAGSRIAPAPMVPGMTTGSRVTVRGGQQQQPGGLLGFLLRPVPTPQIVQQAPSVPQRIDPLQLAVAQAAANGQVYDRSRDPSFNPNGGANGGSYSH